MGVEQDAFGFGRLPLIQGIRVTPTTSMATMATSIGTTKAMANPCVACVCRERAWEDQTLNETKRTTQALWPSSPFLLLWEIPFGVGASQLKCFSLDLGGQFSIKMKELVKFLDA